MNMRRSCASQFASPWLSVVYFCGSTSEDFELNGYSEDISPKSGHHRQSSTEDPGTTIGKLLSLPQLKTNFMAMECEMRY